MASDIGMHGTMDFILMYIVQKRLYEVLSLVPNIYSSHLVVYVINVEAVSDHLILN